MWPGIPPILTSGPRQGHPPAISQETDLKIWLDNFEQKLEIMSVAYNEASYNRYLGRKDNNLNQFDAALNSLLADNFSRRLVQHWLPLVKDASLKRRLELLKKSFAEAEVTKNASIYSLRNSINDQLISFQPKFRGKNFSRNDLQETLRKEPDRTTRKAVFEEVQQPLARHLEPPVRELMKRRNAEARLIGFANFPDFYLELLGLTREKLFVLFDELEKFTNKPFQNFLEQGKQQLKINRVEQWDLNFLAEQQLNLPEGAFLEKDIITKVYEFLRLFGLDPAKLPVRLEICELPFGGLCYSIKIPEDIRILYNPRNGYSYYRTLFHEFGHALHGIFNRQENFILKREGGSFNEGMAEVLVFFTQYPEWWVNQGGLTLNEAEDIQKGSQGRRLLRLRSLMAQAKFEIEAYSNLDCDLDKLYAENEARYLLTPFNPTPRFAASSFPTTHPIYRQNYVLAEVIAAQVHASIREKYGNFWNLNQKGREEIFSFLEENFYAPGASIDWQEKIRLTTGEALNSKFLGTELS